MVRVTLAFLLVFPIFLPSDARAQTVPASELLERLDEARDREDVKAIGRWLSELEADPAAVSTILTRGRSYAPVQERDFEMEITGADGRRSVARILVPDDYDPSRPTPLLLSLHGRGANQNQMVRALGEMSQRGWIVACPAARPTTATRDPGVQLLNAFSGGHWWRYDTESLVFATLTELRQRFHIDDDRIVLSGHSMGGFGTWNIGLRFHPLFAGIASISGAISTTERIGIPNRRTRRLIDNAHGLPIYAIHGNADNVVPHSSDLWTHQALEQLGLPHIFHLVEGGRHMLPVVYGRGEHREELLDWIDERRRDSIPTETRHTLLDTDHGAGHWVEVLRKRSSVARFEATLDRQAHRIEIETSGVRQIRIHLLDELLDLERPVTVVVDGMLVHDEPVEPSIDAVLESWWAFRGDRRRVTAYSIDLALE